VEALKRFLPLLLLLVASTAIGQTRTEIVAAQNFTGTDAAAVCGADPWDIDQNAVDGQVRYNTNSYVNGFSNPADCRWDGTGTFTDDQYFIVTLVGTWSGSDNDGIGGNLRNNGGDYAARVMYRVLYIPSAGGVQIFEVRTPNGTPTQLGATCTATFTPGQQLSANIVTNGGQNDITVYQNAALLCTRSDTTTLITGGKPGISTGIGSTLAIRGDDWSAGNVTPGSPSTALSKILQQIEQ
jgi:hypothetical protein